MKNKGFFRRVGYILPISLFILFISSPIGAQTDYPINVVPPNYIEASTPPLPLTGDGGSFQVELPFPFTFHGVPYTQAYVNPNGYLDFLSDKSYGTNKCIPRPTDPNGAIYAFWDDLVVDPMASMHTELRGTEPKRQFIIEWRNVTFYDDGVNRIDFEIVLYETGAILLQYRNIDDNFLEKGKYATIGLENPAGDTAAQFSCNTAAIEPGQFAILFGNMAKDVPVDIKPRACPNPINLVSRGLLPVAILGTVDFDVSTIDPANVTLQGVRALRWSLQDVASPYEPFVGKTDIYQCNSSGPDGKLDMVFKFDKKEVAAAIGDANANAGQALLLKLEGNLQDGTAIKGEDSVVIIRGHHKWEKERQGHHKKEKKKHHHKKEKDREDDD